MQSGEPVQAVAMPADTLRRELSSFGVVLLALSCLSPVLSIYGMGSDVLQGAGTGAALLFGLGILVAIVWAVNYAELASAFPYAGGDYVGVGAILGPWAAFGSLTVWVFSAGPSVAFMAKTFALYLSEALPGLPAQPVEFGSLAAALVVGLLAVRTSALVTGIFLAIEMGAVLVLIWAGISLPLHDLGSVLAPAQAVQAGSLHSVAMAAMAIGGINAAYATMGGNQAISFGEELRDPHRNMGGAVLVAALIGAFATALPVILVVLSAGDPVALLGSSEPFGTFIAGHYGPGAARALSAGVALAVFNAMIAQLMFFGRLFFSLGRDQVLHGTLNRLLARVHARSGVPRAATVAVGLVSAACCLLDKHVLLVAMSGSVAITFYLVVFAVWVGRRKGLTGGAGRWRAILHPLAPLLGVVVSTAFLVAALADEDAGRPSILVLAVLLALALAWNHFVLQRRPGGWSPRLDLH